MSEGKSEGRREGKRGEVKDEEEGRRKIITGKKKRIPRHTEKDCENEMLD